MEHRHSETYAYIISGNPPDIESIFMGMGRFPDIIWCDPSIPEWVGISSIRTGSVVDFIWGYYVRNAYVGFRGRSHTETISKGFGPNPFTREIMNSANSHLHILPNVENIGSLLTLFLMILSLC